MVVAPEGWKPFVKSGPTQMFLNETVLEAGLRRTRWLFDEFENVVVSWSGGKDSTVVLNLALKVAEERGRLPLPVMFLDQEAEWQSVIDFTRQVMDDPRVEPHWLQVPFRIFNATSTTDQWLTAWEPGAEWMREKEPDAITENVFGTDRFKELFGAYMKWRWPEQPVCALAGVRCEESPARRRGLTSAATYKGETWGQINDRRRGHYTMYPLYDWMTTDIWKAIHEHGWSYCPIYDYQYQYGIKLSHMRVSNLHHETAVETLFYLQEIESDTWQRMVKRVSGINSAGHLKASMMCPQELPSMFKDWTEYRDHLVENMIPDEETRAKFRKIFETAGRHLILDPKIQAKLMKAEIQSILVNDYHGTKVGNFIAAHAQFSVNAGKKRREREAAASRAAAEAAA